MGDVIPFPAHEVGTDDLVDDPIEGFSLDLRFEPEDDPDVIEESDGRWVWEPADGAPETEVHVGMVAHKIATMCKWTHRHLMEDVPIPQPCCYSVLITTKRLPGPVRQTRSWLAPEEGDVT